MALLLAIETSGELCSVAIGDGKGRIAEARSARARGHNEFLLPAIDDLLSAGGYRLRQLDGIAVGVGPGSFTGLRLGIGVAQGLALGADLGVIPVSSLAALAQAGVRDGELVAGELAVPAVDARMGQVYWGCYELVADLVVALTEDRLGPPQALAAELGPLRQRALVGLGDGWGLDVPPGLELRRCRSGVPARAAEVLRLAQREARAGEVLAPERLEPRYLRGSEHWRQARRAGATAGPGA